MTLSCCYTCCCSLQLLAGNSPSVWATPRDTTPAARWLSCLHWSCSCSCLQFIKSNLQKQKPNGTQRKTSWEFHSKQFVYYFYYLIKLWSNNNNCNLLQCACDAGVPMTRISLIPPSHSSQPAQPTLATSLLPSSPCRTGYFLGCRQFVCRIFFVVNSFFDLFRIVFGIDSSSTWLDFCTLRTTWIGRK